MSAATADELLQGTPFALAQRAKEAELVPLLQREMARAVAACPEVRRLAERQRWTLERCRCVADLPFIPVSMFKHFELRMVPADKIVRELRSSTTTGQAPSRIFVDKVTSFRQARALALVLKDFLGGQRRPFLVLDVPESVPSEASALTARGAAIRGIANFATETTFAMQSGPDGSMQLALDALERFLAAHGDEEVLLFGFTFMVWKYVVLELERLGRTCHLPRARLLHSGGWKKLKSERVTKAEFNNRTAQVLGCDEHRILDFYGMVEQVGTVFVDCEAGNKHSPIFADVVIRDPLTLAPLPRGVDGLIEVVSVLPASYPGHALMTEDLGQVIGVDDCPCGRRGMYFRFTSRVEQVEIRGCGDTHAAGRPAR